MSIWNKVDNAKPTTWLVDGMTQEEVRECIDNGKIKCAVLNALEDVRAEITGNLETIIGKYDSNTKPEDMPSRKFERNNGRTEAIDIINRKIAEVTKNDN